MMLKFLTFRVYFRFYCRKPEYQIFPDTLYHIEDGNDQQSRVQPSYEAGNAIYLYWSLLLK